MTTVKSPSQRYDEVRSDWLDRNGIDPWYISEAQEEEWDEKSKKLTSELEACPEFQRRIKNTEILLRVFSIMVCPDPLERLLPGSPYSKQEQLYIGLRRYCRWHHWNLSTHAPDLDIVTGVGPVQSCILESCKASCTPFKVGVSLYLFQQMVDRKLASVPGLGKAAWLLTYAPIIDSEPGLRKDGANHDKIGKDWKDCFEFAHYWAAFAVVTGTPLEYRDSLPLHFLCNADANEFLSIAAALLEFRRRAPSVKRKGQAPQFIKQGLEAYSNFVEGIRPKPALEIPNLLHDFQWNALSKYRPGARKDRERSPRLDR